MKRSGCKAALQNGARTADYLDLAIDLNNQGDIGNTSEADLSIGPRSIQLHRRPSRYPSLALYFIIKLKFFAVSCLLRVLGSTILSHGQISDVAGAEVYGDEANFSKQGDAFTALMFTFTLHRPKGPCQD